MTGGWRHFALLLLAITLTLTRLGLTTVSTEAWRHLALLLLAMALTRLGLRLPTVSTEALRHLALLLLAMVLTRLGLRLLLASPSVGELLTVSKQLWMSWMLCSADCNR